MAAKYPGEVTPAVPMTIIIYFFKLNFFFVLEKSKTLRVHVKIHNVRTNSESVKYKPPSNLNQLSRGPTRYTHGASDANNATSVRTDFNGAVQRRYF